MPPYNLPPTPTWLFTLIPDPWIFNQLEKGDIILRKRTPASAPLQPSTNFSLIVYLAPWSLIFDQLKKVIIWQHRTPASAPLQLTHPWLFTLIFDSWSIINRKRWHNFKKIEPLLVPSLIVSYNLPPTPGAPLQLPTNFWWVFTPHWLITLLLCFHFISWATISLISSVCSSWKGNELFGKDVKGVPKGWWGFGTMLHSSLPIEAYKFVWLGSPTHQP